MDGMNTCVEPDAPFNGADNRKIMPCSGLNSILPFIQTGCQPS